MLIASRRVNFYSLSNLIILSKDSQKTLLLELKTYHKKIKDLQKSYDDGDSLMRLD